MGQDVDEPIEVVGYDPEWPRRFDDEARRLRAGITGTVGAVEPFGSTAVPGMAGKPIVDILVGVEGMADAHRVAVEVEALGYENFGEVFIPGRVYLRRRGPPHFNVAITVQGGGFWQTQILVRDYLRAHPDEVEAYSKSKRHAVASGATLFSSYSQSKAPFLTELVTRAERWRAAGAGGRR